MNVAPTQLNSIDAKNGALNLRDILTVLFKFKHSIIIVSLLFTLASLVLVFFMTPVYEAETSLLVKIGREHMFTTEANDSTHMAIDLKTIVDPELAILASQDLRHRVLETIGVHIMYPDLVGSPPDDLSLMQVALLRFEENLRVHQEAASNVIQVTFQHGNPKMAAEAVNTLVKFWKEKHLKIFSTPQALFLQKQALSYRARFEETETQLQQFHQEHGISAFPKQKELLLEQRQELDASLKVAQSELQSLGAKLASLVKQMKAIPKEIPLSTVNEQRRLVDDTKRELLVLLRKEQELSAKYQGKSRPLVELRKEIDLIRTFIREHEDKFGDTVTSGRNPVYQQLKLELLSTKSQYAALQTKDRVLTKQLQGLDDQVRQLSQLQQMFDKLDREATKDEENLRRYVDKVEAAKITEKMDRQQIANVSVIQAATIPINPMKSPKTTIIIFGLIIGVMAGIALALVLEYLRTSYTRPEQITYELGLPILVSITSRR